MRSGRVFKKSRRQMNSKNMTDAQDDLPLLATVVVTSSNGTMQVRFRPVPAEYWRTLNDTTEVVNSQIQCITAMEFYKGHSLEELRINDYQSRAFAIKPSNSTRMHFVLKPLASTGPVFDLTQTDEEAQLVANSWPPKPRADRVQQRKETSSKFGADFEKSSAKEGTGGTCEAECLATDTVYGSANSELVSSPTIQLSTFSTNVSILKNNRTAETRNDREDFDVVYQQKSSPVGCDINLDLKERIERLIDQTSVDREKHTVKAGTAETIAGLTLASKLDTNDHLKTCTEEGKLKIDGCHLKDSPRNESSVEGNSTGQNHECHFQKCNNRSFQTGGFHVGCHSSEVCDPIIGEVCRLTELQGALCVALSQSSCSELLCCHLIDELHLSRSSCQFEKLSCNVLCLEVRNREMMIRLLMDFLTQSRNNGQLHRCILLALTEEFGFIGRLKQILLTKSLYNGEHQPQKCPYSQGSRDSVPDASGVQMGDAHNSAFKPLRGSDVQDRISDTYAQRLLDNDTDILIFREPGQLFHFEVQPGSQFVENWTERGSKGVVSVYQDEAESFVKILVCHWSTKRNYSLIHIRSSMKAKLPMSKDGLELKFFGLEVTDCRERMRYFKLCFETRDVALKFRSLLSSMSFLNISCDDADSSPTCCLDFVFKSQRVHEEFPYEIPECDLETGQKLSPGDVTLNCWTHHDERLVLNKVSGMTHDRAEQDNREDQDGIEEQGNREELDDRKEQDNREEQDDREEQDNMRSGAKTVNLSSVVDKDEKQYDIETKDNTESRKHFSYSKTYLNDDHISGKLENLKLYDANENRFDKIEVDEGTHAFHGNGSETSCDSDRECNVVCVGAFRASADLLLPRMEHRRSASASSIEVSQDSNMEKHRSLDASPTDRKIFTLHDQVQFAGDGFYAPDFTDDIFKRPDNAECCISSLDENTAKSSEAGSWEIINSDDVEKSEPKNDVDSGVVRELESVDAIACDTEESEATFETSLAGNDAEMETVKSQMIGTVELEKMENSIIVSAESEDMEKLNICCSETEKGGNSSVVSLDSVRMENPITDGSTNEDQFVSSSSTDPGIMTNSELTTDSGCEDVSANQNQAIIKQSCCTADKEENESKSEKEHDSDELKFVSEHGSGTLVVLFTPLKDDIRILDHGRSSPTAETTGKDNLNQSSKDDDKGMDKIELERDDIKEDVIENN